VIRIILPKTSSKKRGGCKQKKEKKRGRPQLFLSTFPKRGQEKENPQFVLIQGRKKKKKKKEKQGPLLTAVYVTHGGKKKRREDTQQ